MSRLTESINIITFGGYEKRLYDWDQEYREFSLFILITFFWNHIFLTYYLSLSICKTHSRKHPGKI